MMESPAKTVLIVDDEPDMRELLCDALAQEGLAVTSAATGAEACELARRLGVDMLVADLRLPDCSGLDVIDRLRAEVGELPAVVITGAGDARLASEATGRGCADFLTKPLDLPRLRRAVRREMDRQQEECRSQQRSRKLLSLARHLNHQRHGLKEQINTTCSSLTTAYRTLARQMMRQEEVLRFQRFLITCQNDDDIFRGLFRFYSERGSVFGLAMVCDSNADLQLVGRFGTVAPESVETCQQIASALMELVLDNPVVMRLDGIEHQQLFPKDMQPGLAGTTFLCIPFLPQEGQLIGLSILYRKGEQPFTDEEAALAQMLAPAVALAIQSTSKEAQE